MQKQEIKYKVEEKDEESLKPDMEGLTIIKGDNGEPKINTSLYQLFQVKPLNQFLEMLCQKFYEKDQNFATSDWKVLYWAIAKLQRYPRIKQPRHLDDLDKSYIKQLREMHFSYEEIAFVLDRSKSTIFEYAEKEGLK